MVWRDHNIVPARRVVVLHTLPRGGLLRKADARCWVRIAPTSFVDGWAGDVECNDRVGIDGIQVQVMKAGRRKRLGCTKRRGGQQRFCPNLRRRIACPIGSPRLAQ